MTICCFILYFIEVPKNCNQQNDICKEKILTLLLTTVSFMHFYINFVLYEKFQIIRFGITLYAVILVTYTSEIYPTSMRSKAYGLCMTIGRTGYLKKKH